MKAVKYNGELVNVLYKRSGITILDISKWYTHKGYLFLLSVVTSSIGTSAMWSTHSLANIQSDLTFNRAKDIFRKSHIAQIKKMIKEEEEREPAEFKIPSIHDLTVPKCS